MPLLFVFIIVPILFLLVIWVAVTSYRIYFPDQAVPFEKDPRMMRERARKSGRSMPVGFREIREDQRRLARKRQRASTYEVGCGPHGVPEGWKEELWQRRN